MADNTLEIVLTAETEQATKQLANATKAISALDKTAKSAKGFDNLSKSATNATPALTNFGRVIQDAPFGIIGVANNIDPLIASFQSLSKQAGGTGGALKALFAGLAGPAGIAIGVSAVTSALIAFGPQISAAISGVSKFEQAQRDAGEKGAEAFAKANDQFRNFLRLATDSGNSLARQNDAFENANKLLDDYGLKINSLSDFQKNGAQIGALYAQIKQEEAKATVLAGKAAEAYAKQVAIGIKAQQGDISILSDFSFGDIANAILGSVNGPAGVATATVDGYTNALQKAKDEEKLFNAETQNIRTGIDGLIKQLKGVGGVTEDFGGKTKKSTSAIKEANAVTVDWLKWADEQILKQQQLAKGYLDAAAAAKEATRAAAAQVGIREAPTTAPENLTQSKTVINGIQNVQNLVAAAQAASDAATEQERLDTATKSTNAAFALLSPAIDQAFNALANGQDAAEAVKQALKQMIVQLIKAVVQAAILATVMNALFPGSSAASGGFQGIFKRLMGFGNKANGGIAGSGKPIIVGENGPEMFIPSTTGQVIPNMALSGAGGGTLTATVRGQDLLFILNQATSTFGRNFR